MENTPGNSQTEHQWAKTTIQFNQDKPNKYIQVQKSVTEIQAGRCALTIINTVKKDFN